MGAHEVAYTEQTTEIEIGPQGLIMLLAAVTQFDPLFVPRGLLREFRANGLSCPGGHWAASHRAVEVDGKMVDCIQLQNTPGLNEGKFEHTEWLFKMESLRKLALLVDQVVEVKDGQTALPVAEIA
jgi:hypothetical protein